ncbi:substrate-binding domain-containing protein [Thermodesulfobacteriota bacterium]
MKQRLGLFILISSALFILSVNVQAQDKTLKMSTTTSTRASGLLEVLLPELKKDTGIVVKVIAKGTGAAIRDGMDGNVDVIFVHAKTREKKFVADGYGTKRYAIMHNDFVIVGPPADPAGIMRMQDAPPALKKIADQHALFVSRGDDSGTHTKEQALWNSVGIPLTTRTLELIKKGKKRQISFVQPEGSEKWYLSIGQGMGKVLTFADEKRAYTLTDRGTYIKYKHGRKTDLDLIVLCEGDPLLNNPYGVIPINPAKYPHVRHDRARQFAKWLVSPRGQSVIANYRLLGKQLFYPDVQP